MRPFRFLFPVLLMAVAAFVLLKILFFLAFGVAVLGMIFIAARAFRRFGPGARGWHHGQAYEGAPAWANQPNEAEPLDPRQARRTGEPLAGDRFIEVI